MTARQLPERPNLDHLKRQAKDLLRDAQTQDAVALARFRLLPALAPRPDADLARTPIGLHDTQSLVPKPRDSPLKRFTMEGHRNRENRGRCNEGFSLRCVPASVTTAGTSG